jgi:hypothetical protein
MWQRVIYVFHDLHLYYTANMYIRISLSFNSENNSPNSVVRNLAVRQTPCFSLSILLVVRCSVMCMRFIMCTHMNVLFLLDF